MNEEPHFGNGNYDVCFYCKNLRVFESLSRRSDECESDYGCNLEKDPNGKYPSLIRFEQRSDDLSLLQKGCGDFLSSGLPVHPIVRKEIVEINLLTKGIPVDPNAIENSFEFDDKIKRYLDPEQVHEGKDLVYRVNTFQKH